MFILTAHNTLNCSGEACLASQIKITVNEKDYVVNKYWKTNRRLESVL